MKLAPAHRRRYISAIPRQSAARNPRRCATGA